MIPDPYSALMALLGSSQRPSEYQRKQEAMSRAQFDAHSPAMEALLRQMLGAQQQRGGLGAYQGYVSPRMEDLLARGYVKTINRPPLGGKETAEQRRRRRVDYVKAARITQCRTKAIAELREYLGETLWTFPERVKKIVDAMDEVFSA